MKYNVEIRETLSRLVQVDAPTSTAAHDLVFAQYKESNIVLSADDFVDVEIIATRDHSDPYYKSSNKDFTLISSE